MRPQHATPAPASSARKRGRAQPPVEFEHPAGKGAHHSDTSHFDERELESGLERRTVTYNGGSAAGLECPRRHPSVMRLQVLSDLHFEYHADAGQSFVESLDPTGVDVLVLAGDIAAGAGIPHALALFCERYGDADVVYVHGNHEYYGADRAWVKQWTREAALSHRNLTWLDCSVAEVRGQRFIGGPLWFRHSVEIDRQKPEMRDFLHIPELESWVYDESRRMRELLQEELREGDVVVSHHLPSERCVAPRYAEHPMNVIFVCDVEALIIERRPRLWLHGHTHESLNTRVGDTRVVCNPFGYVTRELNPQFSERAFVEW